MTVYKRPPRPAGGWYFWLPFCVTNQHRALFWAAAIAGEAACLAFIGAVIGAAWGGPFTALIAATGIGALPAAFLEAGAIWQGLVIGAVVGAAIGLAIAWNSDCPTCGSCFEILSMRLPIAVGPFIVFFPVVPFVIRPSPADCATMIPPGCP